MKRTERHHLKENLLATWITRIRDAGGSQLFRYAILTVMASLLVGGVVYGFSEWREAQASESLARAMTIMNSSVTEENDTNSPTDMAESFPTLDSKLEAALPLLIETADNYPSLQQGVAARYQLASALGILGRTLESGVEYQKVIDSDPNGLYGGMSRLGRAEVHLASEEYDEAINLLQEAVNEPEAVVPLDGALMRLGNAYKLSGRSEDALSTFRRVINEASGSTYRFDATREIEILGGNP